MKEVVGRKGSPNEIKIRALWLANGDENTICFLNYANHGKIINTVWDKMEDGSTA